MRSDLENFRATVEHRRPGRILAYADFTPDLRSRLEKHARTKDLAAHYAMPRREGIWFGRPAGIPAPDYSRYWHGYKKPAGSFVNSLGVLEEPARFYHFTGYVSPLRNAQSLADIENFPMEDPATFVGDDLAGKVRAAHARGAYVDAWVGHMYENAWQVRDYEGFLMDMIDRPAWAECLLERFMQINLARATAYARAGADLIRTGDDVANQKTLMFSPDMWRRMMLSRWRKVWEAVHSINPACMIWYHSDGNIGDIAGELIEAGVNILNPLQPECLDIDAIHRRYGKVVSFDGTIGTQSTMPFGTPSQVKARVREVIEKYGRDGGLFISPTHVLEPEVPIANIDAMFVACREYGTFE